MKYQGIAVLALAGAVSAFPKYETLDKGSASSKTDYVPVNRDQIAMESSPSTNITDNQGELKDRPARFGFPTYSSDIQTTGHGVGSAYGPVKLDIGGLVLGTILGLGAFFVLPKLLHVVSTPYGGYKRSEDASNGFSGLGEIMSTVQNSLNSYNIDSTACLQRAICVSLQSANENSNNTSNSLENVVGSVVKNDALNSLIDGTEWKKAVNVGESGENCNLAFPKCPSQVDTIISAIANYLTS